MLEYDPASGVVTNLTNGLTFQSVPVAPFVAEVAEAGGLMSFIRQKIADGKVSTLR
jgi:3-isopropylmalate/(R)-2-methylmalate dehydratase small subunit